VVVCRQSGYRAMDICPDKDTMWVQNAGLNTAPCMYHKLIHLDAGGKYRVTSDCEDVNNMQHVPWFILPPAQEWYYKSRNPSYRELPPFRADCMGSAGLNSMELIYPKQLTKIYVPVELDGKKGKCVFEVAHRRSNATIYWHLDNDYVGETKGIHQMGLSPDAGIHVLTLVDENGETLVQKFEIIDKE
jgi:penicillin-binding protein 1C